MSILLPEHRSKLAKLGYSRGDIKKIEILLRKGLGALGVDFSEFDAEERLNEIRSDPRIEKILIGPKEREQIERLKKVGISLDPMDFEKIWGFGDEYPDDFPAEGGAS